MPIFWRVLIINECWILSKAFSASVEIIFWFLSFNLLIHCVTLIDICILKNPCLPWISPIWSWCMSFLMCCWILFAKILLKIFNHKWVLNFIKGFFCIYWGYHMVFIFQFVNMVYHIDWCWRILASLE